MPVLLSTLQEDWHMCPSHKNQNRLWPRAGGDSICGLARLAGGDASAVNTMNRVVSGTALAAGSSHRGSSENHILVGQRSREPAASAVPLTG